MTVEQHQDLSGKGERCPQCAQPIAPDALFCLHCGSRLPRTAESSARPIASPSGSRPASRPWWLPIPLAVVAMLVLAGVVVTHRSHATLPPTAVPRVSHGPTAALIYVMAIRREVLKPTATADGARGRGVQLMQGGNMREAAGSFDQAVHSYGAAITHLTALHPPDSYLLYHDDLIQALNDDLRSAVSYSQWAASRNAAQQRAGASLAQQAAQLLVRASRDAPAS